MSSENFITIKLEIEIPVGAQVGVPEVKTTTRPGKKIVLLSHVVNQPAGDVPCHWDGATGWVCASGQAFDNGEKANRVNLKVYPGLYTGGAATVPDPGTTPVSNLSLTGNWGNVEISGVTGNPTNGINHTLVCWAEWPDGTVTRASSAFRTLWSPHTACYPGLGQIPSPVEHANQPLELLPIAWQVRLRGFFGTPLSRLNGEWTLRLASPANFPIIFCSGGDGIHQSRIQLRCAGVAAAAWELVLETGGCRVTYTCPGPQFDNQRRNVFQNAFAVGVGEDVGIPAMISVVPA